MKHKSENILGFEVATADPTVLAEEIIGAMSCTLREERSSGKSKTVSCFNPHSYRVSKHDSAFATALRNSDLLIPDGIGVVLASLLSKGKIKRRVTGFDIFQSVLKAANDAGGARIFFLGASVETLAAIKVRLPLEYPNLENVASYSPPYEKEFSPEQSQAMLEAIEEFSPEVVFVGMTAPKQEKWVEQHREQIKAIAVLSIGAVFDFYAGKKSRGPSWLRAVGMEWIVRLGQEPGRLWRRTFISAPVFLMDLLGARNSNSVNRRRRV